IVWLSVQRSGRTSIRAPTRSLSASVNVTPFNSAKGIFIEWIFSSGVMIGNPYIDRSRHYRSPKNDSNNDASNRQHEVTSDILSPISCAHALLSSPPDRVSHRRNRGDVVSARRAGPNYRGFR